MEQGCFNIKHGGFIMIIQHNIMALNAHRQLSTNTTSLQKNIEKLSSGFKINRAGDDASGLAISEKMRAQIAGLQVAQNNAQDGISLIQTAEGALTEVHLMLNRMVELAEKSANGTIQDSVDRDAIQKEVDDLLSEIDRISKATNFNGINLLDGTLGASTATNSASGNISADATATNTVTMTGLEVGTVVEFVSGDKVATQNVDEISINYSATDKKLSIKLGADSEYTAEDINQAIAAKYATDPVGNAVLAGVKVSSGSVVLAAGKENLNLGTISFKEPAPSTKANDVVGTNSTFSLSATKSGATGVISFTVANGDQGITNVSGAVTLTLVADKTYSSADVSDMLKGQGIDWSASFAGNQTGAQILAGFGNETLLVTDGTGTGASGLTLQIGDTNESHQKVTVAVDNLSSDGLGINGLDVSAQEAAGSAIASIKSAINKVSTNRANLGGLQNRLEHTINNLSVTEENMTAAEARIRDVDMAKEMMAYTKNNVLTQAAQAMLAQANTQPQSVLQLLQ
jgi:flagellin